MSHSELYKGDANDEVKLLQTMLGINADGVFGDQTEAAVIKFQSEHNLDADGIVGAMTWAALEAKAAKTTKTAAKPEAETVAFQGMSGFGGALGDQV
jgi:peptidoglycan hydrolase-like protein with peptidoglycan-binding domain